MSAVGRLLIPLVAYLCIGTVISASIGYVYLRHSGNLSDETMFRMLALLHGIDLDQVDETAKKPAPEVPPEEPSYDQQQEQFQAATLHFDAKQKQLADSLSDFDFQLKRLSVATNQYGLLKQDVESYLKKQSDVATDAALQKVRTQVEAMIPKKQAKPILIKMIEDNRLDEVILLMGSMKQRTQIEIIRSFDTDADIDMLYRIQRRMLTGNTAKQFIDSQLNALDKLKQQEK